MVLVATQVKRRRGTTAENDAFTGAEGEITVDTEKHELRVHDGVTQGGFKIGGGSGSGRNIGDIFYTARTDESLAGAVECNGGTYNTTDYEGDGSIGELLEAGKLPYVSLAQYTTLLSTNDVVGVFGWDGTGTTTFRVPTLQDIFIECGQVSELGSHISAGLPDIQGYNGTNLGDSGVPSGAFQSQGRVTGNGGGGGVQNRMNFYAHLYNPIYGNSDTVQPKAIKYRAMIQLFNGTTDEAFATCSEVLADVGSLKTLTEGMIDYVVESQEATAENGYTWYKLYKSGRVEQGGNVNGGTSQTPTFPIEMADTHYTVAYGNMSGTYEQVRTNAKTTTSITIRNANNGGTVSTDWQVSGKSAQ